MGRGWLALSHGIRPAHLRGFEPSIGNNVTHPFVSTLLPTWLEWTQTNRPRVLEFCVSIESVE